MGNIKPGKPPKPANIPAASPPSDDLPLLFSFKLLDLTSNEKFCLEKCGDGYLEKFLVRFRDMSTVTVRQFRTNRSSALRAHPIEWPTTSEPNGFSRLNAQLRGEEAWQFEITANEHGRVHGLLIDDTFFLVWIDPDHLLYPAP